MPSLANHIHRRGGVYHLRCRVPRDLLQRVRRQEIRRSLGTASPSEAKTRAARLYGKLMAVFEEIRSMSDAKQELVNLLIETVQIQEEVTAKEIANAKMADEIAQLRRTLAELRRIDTDIHRAEVGRLRLDRISDKLDRVALDSSPAVAAAKVSELRSLMEDAGVFIRNKETKTVLEYLISDYDKKKTLQDDGKRHINHYVTLFAKILGDRQFPNYTASDVVTWVRVLERLRTSIGKSPKDKDRSVDELLASSEGKPTMNATTIEKHVTHVKAFFKSAAKEYRWAHTDEVEEMFDDIELSDFVPDSQKRKIWSIPQLNALFQSPIWKGTRSDVGDFSKRDMPGNNVYRDAYWWLPVISLWTGARLEEAAQLRKEDLIFDKHGTPCIFINDEGPRRTKNENSNRIVPIHSKLLEIGFLNLFGQADENCQVFPELQPTGRLKKLGDTYSSHFTDYRRRCGLYEPLRDFHSLRRTFITFMRNKANVDVMTVAAIAGHDEDLPEFTKFRQTDDYTDYDASDLKLAIEKLDYVGLGLDTSLLLPAV